MNSDQVGELLDEVLDASIVLGFSRLGIAARRQLGAWAEDLPSLAGRTVVVTGGSSGLGQAAATSMSALGASVWLLVRDEQKGVAAQAAIAEATGNDDVSFLLADLADLATVRDVATELQANVDRLDVLVHNAGALVDSRRVSVDGIELTLQTHVVAPFLLTALLLPQLDAAHGRVITVASGGLYAQPLVIDDLESTQDYRGSIAHARAKRAQVLLTEEASERLAGRGVTFHAMHPGWSDTPGIQSSLPTFHQFTGPLLRSPEEGADTIVWLAAAPAETIGSGRFWMDRRPRPTHKVPWTRRGDADRAELWDRVAALSGVVPAHRA